jgi:hypothetical protein
MKIEFHDTTALDTTTNLVWTRNGNLSAEIPSKKSILGVKINKTSSSMSYEEAFDFIATVNALKFASYNDWRLPILSELCDFAKKGGNSPAEYYNQNGFYNVQNGHYFSYKYDPNDIKKSGIGVKTIMLALTILGPDPGIQSVVMATGNIVNYDSRDGHLWLVRNNLP